MTALPRGLDKEVRGIVAPALERGWSAKHTSNGHLLLRHPNGGTAMAPSKRGSYRNIKNLAADIRRAEREGESMVAQTIEGTPVEHAAGGWEPTKDGRFYRCRNGDGGYQYRCTGCGLEEGLTSPQKAGKHWRFNHRREPALAAVPDAATLAHIGADREPADAGQTGITSLAWRITDLLSAELAELAHLRAENARLKDTLAALASLAAEA